MPDIYVHVCVHTAISKLLFKCANQNSKYLNHPIRFLNYSKQPNRIYTTIHTSLSELQNIFKVAKQKSKLFKAANQNAAYQQSKPIRREAPQWGPSRRRLWAAMSIATWGASSRCSWWSWSVSSRGSRSGWRGRSGGLGAGWRWDWKPHFACNKTVQSLTNKSQHNWAFG